MRTQRPTRIIITVAAVAVLITGGVLLFLPHSKQQPITPANLSRLTTAPAASGASISPPVTAPAVTPTEPPPTPPGGALPLPAPPAAPDELADDTVVKLRELAEADPAALAESALSQPVSRLRERMLLEALPVWAERDPVAATKWLGQQSPAREFDLGISAVVQHPTMLALPPATALGLASDIVDGSLRQTALRTVVQQWSRRDADRIRTALIETRDLASADRTLLLAELNELTTSH